MEDVLKIAFTEAGANKKIHEAVVDNGYLTIEEVELFKRTLASNKSYAVMKLLTIINYMNQKSHKDELNSDAYARFPDDLNSFLKNCHEYCQKQREEKTMQEELKKSTKRKDILKQKQKLK